MKKILSTIAVALGLAFASPIFAATIYSQATNDFCTLPKTNAACPTSSIYSSEWGGTIANDGLLTTITVPLANYSDGTAFYATEALHMRIVDEAGTCYVSTNTVVKNTLATGAWTNAVYTFSGFNLALHDVKKIGFRLTGDCTGGNAPSAGESNAAGWMLAGAHTTHANWTLTIENDQTFSGPYPASTLDASVIEPEDGEEVIRYSALHTNRGVSLSANVPNALAGNVWGLFTIEDALSTIVWTSPVMHPNNVTADDFVKWQLLFSLADLDLGAYTFTYTVYYGNPSSPTATASGSSDFSVVNVLTPDISVDYGTDQSTAPTCDIWPGIFSATPAGDGAPCMWSWAKWLVVPSARFFEPLGRLLTTIGSSWPFSYVTDFFGAVSGLVTTTPDDCPTWLTIEHTTAHTPATMDICDNAEDFSDALAPDYMQNFLSAIIAAATLGLIAYWAHQTVTF